MKTVLKVVLGIVVLVILSRMPHMGRLGSAYLHLVSMLFAFAFFVAFILRGR
jgi:hypothetical protein